MRLTVPGADARRAPSAWSASPIVTERAASPSTQTERLERYRRVKAVVAPALRFNQTVYEEIVSVHVHHDTEWLDAGCGWHIFPEWREDAERAVVGRARLAIGCDVDERSVRAHRTLAHACLGDLERVPFRDHAFNLITCNMVVEHLQTPLRVFQEFARVLRPGGRVILHTPNAYSYFVLGSRFIPRPLKLRLVARFDGRPPGDVFPTIYRANTVRRLRALMRRAGLREEWAQMVASEAVLWNVHPVLALAELAWIRLTLTSALRGLRASIVASYVKPGGETP